MRFLVALVALIATPVHSATYNIDVTGQLQSVDFATQGALSNPQLTLLGSDPFLNNFQAIAPITAPTTGFATFSDVTRNYSGCTGLLTPFCRADPGFGFKLANGDWGASGASFSVILGPTNMNYQTDTGFGFIYQGNQYSGFGLNMNIGISSLSVSEVPLPAGVLLLLSGLGLLWWRAA